MLVCSICYCLRAPLISCDQAVALCFTPLVNECPSWLGCSRLAAADLALVPMCFAAAHCGLYTAQYGWLTPPTSRDAHLSGVMRLTSPTSRDAHLSGVTHGAVGDFTFKRLLRAIHVSDSLSPCGFVPRELI